MSVLGIDVVLKRVKKEKLIENLGKRELENPEGVGVDLRLGAIHKIISGGAFIEADGAGGLGKRKGVKTQTLAEFNSKKRKQEEVVIKPGDYYLASTLEIINTPKDLMPLVFPRTSLFRAGLLLLNSKTDPGYRGTLTMGLKNLSDHEVTLQMGARICNIVFFKIEGKTVNYRGQHQGGRVSPEKVENFNSFPGRGVYGKVRGEHFIMGNDALMSEKGINIEALKERVVGDIEAGKSFVWVARNDEHREVWGVIVLSDVIREESLAAIEKLHQMKVKVAMITGDNEAIAKNVASKLTIDTYFSQVRPEDKVNKVRELQKDGSIVSMVGDGVNDAPALTQANVGIAIGAGTDVAVEAGQIVLIKNNPMDIVKIIELSRQTNTKMVQNLFWAAGYNVVAIPLAAAKTAAGVARGGPLSGIWGPTFIAKGIIFGFSGGTKATQSKTPIPLFVLKRSVVVPRRIFPKEHLLDWAKPKFMADLSQIVKVG